LHTISFTAGHKSSLIKTTTTEFCQTSSIQCHCLNPVCISGFVDYLLQIQHCLIFNVWNSLLVSKESGGQNVKTAKMETHTLLKLDIYFQFVSKTPRVTDPSRMQNLLTIDKELQNRVQNFHL